MKQSQLFTKTRKEAPKDEVSKNAQLLIQAGFVYKEMAGVYSYLPLGLRVLNKINDIIRKEMNKIGGQELFLTNLQDPKIWEATGRWSDDVVDNWFKTKLKSGTELGLGFTHEEPITRMMKDHISSFRDLPLSAYQIQTKFRNESRAKSGIMRGREFLMKDLYSFSRDEKEHDDFYNKAIIAYTNIFSKVGLGEKTHVTFASGGTFSKYSHEFQTVSDAGEDIIYIAPNGLAVNEEVFNDEVLKDLGFEKKDLKKEKSIEVGNIFSLGTKFSEAFDLTFSDEKGENKFVVMGCYGIGPGRLMGTVVEALSDERGIIWPETIAPFKVHLLSLGANEETEKIYNQLQQNGIEVLFDDRDKKAGDKFADSDLIGIPYRVVVSEKSLSQGGVELKKRAENDGKIFSINDLIELLK
ncbi:TPA: prolyl-tRNA synthetase [Candidatus Campbellbacteria bacterium]|nr:MAG: putative prolyl-tRNA synthetase, prolyl-tRNA synthetase [Candidatus Campbellbacteria bacterium GW2011_OD1_34_28]KKP74604.1 MAG: Proline-tRNA ligase [Candidatus Campbellbacteria bacterium GW2011_GWD2_35_24]KKP76736.1 MAG: Proline-tRNA ligase [Candidatus Campbellbacteria bacterium GW2011_GWC1_35_31]KKP78693.1 MAG: Proline-tRNA ligase [Candidatus Campbellbacteria bacterium GW2011_GWD1_35_49]HAP74366.1 prolyl-tRNA synthetase [Candidatus Campbellbacteria bacterium]